MPFHSLVVHAEVGKVNQNIFAIISVLFSPCTLNQMFKVPVEWFNNTKGRGQMTCETGFNFPLFKCMDLIQFNLLNAKQSTFRQGVSVRKLSHLRRGCFFYFFFFYEG